MENLVRRSENVFVNSSSITPVENEMLEAVERPKDKFRHTDGFPIARCVATLDSDGTPVLITFT
jgi:hypothetical protein